MKAVPHPRNPTAVENAPKINNMNDNPWIYPVTFETFPELVIERSQEVPVVVDFWAAWCAPCQRLMPLLARLAEEYQGKFILAKVNTDEERDLAQEYQVRSLPTVKIFRSGKVVDEFLGAQPEGVVREYLERHLERKSDPLRKQATQAREQGNMALACGYLRQAHEIEPDNHEISLELVQMLLATNAYPEARTVALTLPAEDAAAQNLLGYLDLIELAQNNDPVHLQATLAADPADHEARYCLACTQIAARNYPPALENLLEIIRRDRKFRNDGARKAILILFEMLGPKHDLTIRSRRRLLNLLH